MPNYSVSVESNNRMLEQTAGERLDNINSKSRDVDGQPLTLSQAGRPELEASHKNLDWNFWNSFVII